MSEPQQPVLVLGGTGHYGQVIVRHLLDAGQPVRVLSRNAAAARALLGERVEVLGGDITAATSREQALAGVRAAVIAVSAFSRKAIRRRMAIERDGVLAVLEEAARVGVQRVVALSGYEMRLDFIERHRLHEFARPMLDVQRALEASPLDWTILGCGVSMEIFFAMLRGARMMVPGGGPPGLPVVSQQDVGAITAQAVLRDDLGGLRFRVPGPEAISFPAAAARISKVWGRPLRVVRIPLTLLKIAAFLSRPFTPLVRQVVLAATLMNRFPQDLVAEVPADHQRLRDTFDYTPTTLEMEAQRRAP